MNMNDVTDVFIYSVDRFNIRNVESNPNPNSRNNEIVDLKKELEESKEVIDDLVMYQDSWKSETKLLLL